MSLDVTLSVTVDTGGSEPHEAVLYSANITHNLRAMAAQACIYEALWRPGEMLAPDVAMVIRDAEQEGRWDRVRELEAQLPVVHARDLVDPLERGLALLESDPDRFKKYDAPNAWGTYHEFVPWIARYLDACREHPAAIVKVSR